MSTGRACFHNKPGFSDASSDPFEMVAGVTFLCGLIVDMKIAFSDSLSLSSFVLAKYTLRQAQGQSFMLSGFDGMSIFPG